MSEEKHPNQIESEGYLNGQPVHMCDKHNPKEHYYLGAARVCEEAVVEMKA